MIALAVSSAWDRYYASSPFLNLLRSNHPKFLNLSALPHETKNAEYREKINKCEALVCDDVLVQFFDFYKNGPKLMVGGDPHAHRPEQVERLEREYAACDYVLTGAVFSRGKLPQYLYPTDLARAKHVYYPHAVPDKRPDALAWGKRYPTALLSGTLDPAVYPFRAACKDAKGITVLPPNNFQHEGYFETLGKYRAAVTCDSIFGYMVAKYVEIPWMGTALIAPPTMSHEEQFLMGFSNLTNVVWAPDPSRISAMLGLPLGWEKIAEAGAELVAKHHTITKRLDYIALLVERIRSGSFVPDDAKDCFLNLRKGLTDGPVRT